MNIDKKHNKLRRNINIFLIMFSIAVYTIVGILVIVNRNAESRRQTDDRMQTAVYNLRDRLTIENKTYSDKASESLRLFIHFLRQGGQVTEEQDSISRQVTDFVSGETFYRKVPRWTIKGRDISTVQNIIDNIYSLTGSLSAIYQKIPEGYLISASNFDQSDKNLLNDIFIPNSSDIIPIVENAEIYTGNMTILKKQYVASFFPLYINSKINGMISCMRPFVLNRETVEFIKNQNFGKSGYLFAISQSGNVYIHPEMSNKESLHSVRLINIIKQADENGNILTETFNMPDKDIMVCQKTMYIKELDIYIGVCCPESELKINQSELTIIIIALVAGGLLTAMIFVFLNSQFFRLFNKIRNSVELISQGELPEKDLNPSALEPKEIAELEKYVADIVTVKNQRIKCIEKISNGDFESPEEIKPGTDSEADLLADLRKKLTIKSQENRKRLEEEEHSDWVNAGITKFIEILRFHGQDRQVLAYNIISNIVKYLNANQGAIYFTNEENPEHVTLDMAACYAYEKQKLIQGSFSTDEGLLGRAYHENRIINLTELPENYIKIVSGLGGAQPANLVIVPLIFNNKNSGMIEIASFKVFLPHEITFLERIAESIASAISGLKISERTESLLQKSQEQSKLMKIQEVEMRRNLAELRRLKEDAENKDTEMRGLFRAVEATSLVTEYDKDGIITHVNPRVTDLLQMSEEELIGKNHTDISSFSPDNKDYKKFWDDIRHGQTRSMVESIDTKQKKVWISETFSPILDDKGNVMKIINIGMDVSETKVLERQLRMQEREINRQMDKMNEKEKELLDKQKFIEEREQEVKIFTETFDRCMVRIDFNRRGIILYANVMFTNMMMMASGTAVNHDLTEFLVPEAVVLFDTSLSMLLQGKELTEKLRFVSGNTGRKITIMANEYPIINTKGDVERIMLIGSILKEG
ncbi:MAG: Cache 3/Cache 2 fusion domain-containing protein [Bacteroidales bacterium]|nr:Cache 3/Cache 2 fusion domain-containing protein [Bacteroidales bacterium]